MAEENQFFKRLQRYLKVSGTVGGLATKYAVQQAFSKDEEAFAQEVVSWLGKLRGPVVKVAQLVALVPDFLPEKYTEKLLALQSEAPPMGPFFAKRRLKQELGPDWQQKFQSVDLNAVAAASLGQVHKAVLPNGQAVALKLQYPDMASVVEADLQQLKLLFAAYKSYDKTIDHSALFAEISEHLRLELDYVHEAQNLKRFQVASQSLPYVKIPKYHEALSSSKLLTMDWLESQKILAYKEEAASVRNTLAEKLFKAWYTPFYGSGLLHADPHTGNYGIDNAQNLVLYDFGCVRTFDPHFVEGVIDLYNVFKNNTLEKAPEAYEKWGFENLSKDVIEILNMWAGYLYGPLLDDKVRPLDASFSSKPGRKIVAELHQKLKAKGGVKPPRAFVFMDRSAVGLGSVFMHLKAEVNWHRCMEEMIEGINAAKITARQESLKAL